MKNKRFGDTRKLRKTYRTLQVSKELEYAGRIVQLMGCWMKAWELDKLADIEKRLEALEEAQEHRR